MISDINSLRVTAETMQDSIVRHQFTAPTWVTACPGAGKTAAIVRRHLDYPVPRRQGRAVISFTWAAAGEIKDRCGMEGLGLTKYPHFVGTIDRFIWLFFVRPFLSRDRCWNHIESWDRHKGAVVRGIPLEAFDFDRKGACPVAAHLVLSRLRGARERMLADNLDEIQIAEANALAVHRRLTGAGFITGRETRWHAIENLRGEHRESLLRHLGGRFTEVIVDEAQDCSTDDLTILQELADAGIPLMLVGDPDQGIYGYRGADPSLVEAYVRDWTHLALAANWRSSDTITRLAATLRTTGKEPDIAVGPYYDDATPVMLFEYEGSSAGPVRSFLAEAEKLGIKAEECMVLAHGGNSLPKEFAGTAEPPKQALAQAAWAVGVLRLHGTPRRQRAEAEEILGRTILRYWYERSDKSTIARFLEQRGIPAYQFRTVLQRVLRKTPGLALPAVDWGEGLRQALASEPLRADQQRDNPRGSRLQPHTTGVSGYHLAGLTPPEAEPEGRPTFNVVHQVKGEAADAVLVVIPSERKPGRTARTIEAWIAGTPSADPDTAEALRVLYVAVTRARRMIAFALPTQWTSAAATRLRDADIPVLVRERTLSSRQVSLF